MKTIGKKIEDDQPGEPAPQTDKTKVAAQAADAVLGSLSGTAEGVNEGLSAGEGALEKAARPEKVSRRKTSPATSALDDLAEPLKLPKGAIVIMRKSGGLRFTSREVTVHRDGRVTRADAASGMAGEANARLTSATKPQPRRLTRKQLSDLRLTLAKSNLANVSSEVGQAHQNPDAYAYEIVARVGRKVQSVEVFDGGIPTSLQPLIRELNSYLAD